MCFAGIEDDIKSLVRRKLAESIAAITQVQTLNARSSHGHLQVYVQGRGWMRAVDLLEQPKPSDPEPPTVPVTRRPRLQLSASR